MRKLELLSPARNVDIAFQAILHGADAVYMGPPDFGARAAAGNSIDDFRRLTDMAHRYRARVYATVNTVLTDKELHAAERMITDLYKAGVDAIIVQDMGILRLDIPPVELHASTQCDIRTPEKARFLEDVGFSQIVLARELTLDEIRRITDAVSIPVEAFIHGALCVSYSGRCHASAVCKGRSANRGECAQLCRLPYTLSDRNGTILARDKHLLSLRDFNATDQARLLADAGVSSFKIEGRLKDAGYVKNITAHYRRVFDRIIAAAPDRYSRASYGKPEIPFEPRPDKSFNRGFTDYFLIDRRNKGVTSPDTPKSLGEVISNPSQLHNGDGISFFNSKGEYTGVNVNGLSGKRIITSRAVEIPRGAVIHRTNDIEFERQLARSTGKRTIAFSLDIDCAGVTARDERGICVRIPLEVKTCTAEKPFSPEAILSRTGNTIYRLTECVYRPGSKVFMPASDLTRLKNRILEALDQCAAATWRRGLRRPEHPAAVYPLKEVDFRENITNAAALSFHKSHGVKVMERGLEADLPGAAGKKGRVIMTCRHCIMRELGKCFREHPEIKNGEPYILRSTSKERFRLEFNCRECEMLVLTD